MKFGVVGSREFDDYSRLRATLLPYISDIELIVSGGARGADTLAEQFADEFNIPKLILPADWDSFGKKAGRIRNRDIVLNSDVIYAFWDGTSTGTKHTISFARSRGLNVNVISFCKPNKEGNDLWEM